jgi:hypothetical protein
MNTFHRLYKRYPHKTKQTEREGKRVKQIELMGENASAAKSALRLVELNEQEATEATTSEMTELLVTHEPADIIKGLCYLVSVVAVSISGGEAPQLFYKAIRTSMDTAAAQGHDVSVNYKVLDLLDAASGHGGSFYLQIHSMQEPFEVILGLTTLFQTLVKNSLGKEIEEVTEYFAHLIDASL